MELLLLKLGGGLIIALATGVIVWTAAKADMHIARSLTLILAGALVLGAGLVMVMFAGGRQTFDATSVLTVLLSALAGFTVGLLAARRSHAA